MTVKQLADRLARYDGELEVCVRCSWEGEAPPTNLFEPRVVVKDMNADTSDQFVVIDCDQEWDE